MKFRLKVTPAQREIIECKAKNIDLRCGRRWGKSQTFLYRGATRCLGTRGCKYWYVTPISAQCEEMFEYLVSNKALSRYIRRAIYKQPFRLDFTNGSVMRFRTFERPKNLRGSGLHEVWLDEIQDPKYTENDFYSVVKPLVSDKRGTIITSGQFSGKDWKYERLFMPGQDGPQHIDGFKSWCYPSHTGLVFQSDAGKQELADVQAQIPRRVYEQEYLCLPLANANAVLDHEDLIRSKRGEVLSPDAYRAVVLGLDLGRVVDPSAMVGIDAASNTVIYAEKRPLGEKHEIGAKHASQVVRRYGDCEIIVDTTGGATGGRAGSNDAHVQFYQKSCPTMRAFNINRDNKERLITNLSLAIEQGVLAIPAQFEDLHAQLASYEYKLSSSGIITYQGPGGHDDDMVIALALAWEGVLRGWYNTSGGQLGQMIGAMGG